MIGSGAWGTALAQTLSLAGREVRLWAREHAVVESINGRHENALFLPGVRLHEGIEATADAADLAASDAVLLVVPAQHLRAVLTLFAPHLRPDQPAIICTKGVEQDSGQLMGDVAAEVLPGIPLAALSGPSFATDVARGLPTALTLACGDEDLGRGLAESLGSRSFRLYWSRDVIGVELGGAVKNVLAIAAGIVLGKGLGASAHAALVTRGFAEICRLGEALGARRDTLMGLSGLGDLVLTCGSPQSRNMSLGEALGQGRSLAEVLTGRLSVTEGVHTAPAVARLARANAIELPIVEAVAAIVAGQTSVDAAIDALLARPFRSEC